MPVVSSDASASSTPTTKTVYVWQCLGEPGDYALCTDAQHYDYQNPNWRFRGELADVRELDGFPRPTIDNRTCNGWPFVVHRDRRGNYSF